VRALKNKARTTRPTYLINLGLYTLRSHATENKSCTVDCPATLKAQSLPDYPAFNLIVIKHH